MQVNDIAPDSPLPTHRGYVVSITIKSFKGRRDVDVHLFRSGWDPEEMEIIEWSQVLANQAESPETDRSKRFLMEAFTCEEKDALLKYLAARYKDKLEEINASPLTFPIPESITPLSDIPQGADIGLIRFERIPNYPLTFLVHGLYDLSQHKPIVTLTEDETP